MMDSKREVHLIIQDLIILPYLSGNEIMNFETYLWEIFETISQTRAFQMFDDPKKKFVNWRQKKSYFFFFLIPNTLQELAEWKCELCRKERPDILTQKHYFNKPRMTFWQTQTRAQVFPFLMQTLCSYSITVQTFNYKSLSSANQYK